MIRIICINEINGVHIMLSKMSFGHSASPPTVVNHRHNKDIDFDLNLMWKTGLSFITASWLIKITYNLPILFNNLQKSRKKTRVEVISPIRAKKIFLVPIKVDRRLKNVFRFRQDIHCDASLH